MDTLHPAAVLVISADPVVQTEVASALGELDPTPELHFAETADQARIMLSRMEIGVVILDHIPEAVEISSELKLRDNEPAIMQLADPSRPNEVSSMQRVSPQGIVIKYPGWPALIGSGLRGLLRVQKLRDENRRLQAKLTEANQFLEAKNARLDEFCATVAHDIRGPLGGVCMKLDYLLETQTQGLSERVIQIIQRAAGTAHRLTDIVQAMYDFAKLGSKLSSLGPVSTQQLVEEVSSDLSFDASRDIELHVEDLPELWGSSELLRRVFLNLFTNAIKYNDNEKKILKVGVTRIVERPIGKFAEITVEDNGVGISERDIHEIFHMFRRGSTTPRGEGLGVGLAIVLRIVELHYGSIRVERLPVGTKFVLLLPVEEITI